MDVDEWREQIMLCLREHNDLKRTEIRQNSLGLLLRVLLIVAIIAAVIYVGLT